jgi:hypothetical protein
MSRRAKFLAVALGLLLAFRAALPLVIERVVESVGNRFVDGTVHVDDVDLTLLTGGFVLEGLRVDRHTAEDGGPTEPIATLARFALDLAPSSLIAGRLHVQEIARSTSNDRT